jgi:hypothetical protein
MFKFLTFSKLNRHYPGDGGSSNQLNPMPAANGGAEQEIFSNHIFSSPAGELFDYQKLKKRRRIRHAHNL